jgi:hypothetical protein
MNNERMTKIELDRLQCKTPGCNEAHGPLNLRPLCHPHAGNQVVYDRSDGTMTFSCHACQTFIASVVVAAGVH